MKFLTVLLFVYSTTIGIAQTWNEIPPIPLNPLPAETSPLSYDFAVADDGRMYAMYIFDNGTNQQLYVQEYTEGSGWTPIYNDYVYDGFEAIHSFRSGSTIYFFLKRDDAVATEKMRLYSISSGSVGIVTDFNFSGMADGTDYKAVLSESGNYIYMMYQNISVGLKLSQFNISTGTVSTQMIPLNSSTNYNYDLVEHQDTAYIGLTRDDLGTFHTYLHKIPADMSAVLPHHPGNVDGMLGGAGTSSSLMGIVMSKDVTAHNIQILTRDDGQMVRYSFTPADLTTAFTSAYYYGLGGTASATSCANSLGSLYFGAFTDNVLTGTYTTQVIRYDNTSDSFTPYSSYDFNGLGNQGSYYHLSYDEVTDRGVIVLYDGIQSKTRFYKNNHIPVVTSTGTSYTVCPLASNTIFSGISIDDTDGNPITITDVSAADQVMFPAGTITWNQTGQTGNVYTFSINGNATQGGTTTFTITYTDGISTSTYTLPAITVIPVTVPQLTQANIDLCSNNGYVDLSAYGTPVGGTFSLGGSAAPFEGTLFNSDFSGLTYETPLTLQYNIVSNSCPLSASATLTLKESAVVSIATSPTTCGGATGGATATIAGGMAPFTLQSWSSGETSVTSVSGLQQGTYTFTVEGANGCIVITEFAIVANGVDIVPTITNATCNGDDDGQIAINLSGFTAPTSVLWSSGHSSLNPTNLTAGTYSVTVQDASNCIYTETFVLTQPNPLTAVTSSVAPNCGVSDGSVQVGAIAGGTSPYGIAWSTGDLTPSVSNIPAGVYSVTITDFNGCQTIKTVYLSDNNSANLTGTVIGADCGASNGGIDVTPYLMPGEQLQGILWSNGPTTEDMLNVPSALYICTLTTMNNCKAFRGWDIPTVKPLEQPICVITVDSTTSTNLVVWENVQTTGIHHYNIYRETSNQGEYILIDTVEATNISLFNDVVASPINRSWSYKISAVNGCGVEGPLSAPHRTMHLSALANGSQTNVSWNAYEGTAYSGFDLWRYTFANDWELIASLPTTQVTYTDNINFATPGLDYMVELSLNDQCSALVYRAQDFNTTRSNKDKGAFSAGSGTGDSNNDLNEWLLNQVNVFPNPTHDLLIIEQSTSSELFINLTDISGKQLKTAVQSSMSSTLNLGELKPGTYIIELTINNTKRVERIVKL